MQQPLRTSAELVKALELAITSEQNRPDRLPGLVSVFHRLPKLLRDDIDTLVALKPELKLIDLAIFRQSDFFHSAAGSVCAAVKAERWGGNIFFVADAPLSLAFVDAAFGSDGAAPVRYPVREATTVERQIVAQMFKRTARTLADAFSAYVDITFEVVDCAGGEIFAKLPATSAPMLVGRLRMDFAGAEGVLRIAIPQQLLDPIRLQLQTPEPLEEEPVPAGDPDWARQLSDEIARAFILTKAILDERTITLREIKALKVGSTIALSTSSIARARLEIDDRPLFWCSLGKHKQQLALKIETEFESEALADDEF